MKKCSKCKLTMALVMFNKNKSTGDGLQSWCKSCMTAGKKPVSPDAQRRYKETAANNKAWKEKNRNITPAQYHQMLVAQGGVCAICKKSNAHNQVMNVDRDRALLCTPCNTALSMVRNPKWNLALAEYLNTHI